jgi:hypothetical protein
MFKLTYKKVTLDKKVELLNTATKNKVEEDNPLNKFNFGAASADDFALVGGLRRCWRRGF